MTARVVLALALLAVSAAPGAFAGSGAFALGDDCVRDQDAAEFELEIPAVDSTRWWGTCSLHTFGVLVLGIRLAPRQELATVSVNILDDRSNVVRSLGAGPPYTWVWNGDDANGRQVADGAYRVRVETDAGVVEVPFCKRPGQARIPWIRRLIDSPFAPTTSPRTGT
jgi:hypothetical protein